MTTVPAATWQLEAKVHPKTLYGSKFTVQKVHAIQATW